jgi:hypothetical protein
VFGPLKKFLAGQRLISDDDAKTAVCVMLWLKKLGTKNF